MIRPGRLRGLLDEMLRGAGFASWGVARARPLEREHDLLLGWIHEGLHGNLAYMPRRADILRDPSHPSFLSSARSIVMVSLPVTSPDPRTGSLASLVARHARGEDYHRVVARRLRPVLGKLKAMVEGLNGRVFVDTAPVMEKAWAQRAGLGWIGRNGLLVQPRLGSFTVLGGMALTVDVEPDSPAQDGCGDCRDCVDACPVGALRDDRLVDARLCLSCLTVERTAELDAGSARTLRGRAAFGCDLCQLACPHNASPPEGPAEFHPRAILQALGPREFLRLDAGSAGWVLGRTAMQRLGARRFRENVAASLRGRPPSRPSPSPVS